MQHIRAYIVIVSGLPLQGVNHQSIYIFCLKVSRQKLRKQYTAHVMSDTVHSMQMYNTYVNSCLDVLRLLYSLAQPKVSVKVSIKR